MGIREVGTCLECVDPNLCKNAGLVERLVDWEESWELGIQYVQKTRVLKAICGVVAEVRRAQISAPMLVELRESYDAEFFLVLPRIIWLAFLNNPEKYTSLFETLMPTRFGAIEPDAELAAFIKCFQHKIGRLHAVDAWDVLMRRAVSGPTVSRGTGSEEIESL